MGDELFCELGVGVRLRRLLEHLTAEVDGLYAELELPIRVRDFPLLYALDRRGPQTISEIATAAGFTHSALSQRVKALGKLDLVQTRPAEDRRSKVVAFTAAGEALMERVRPVWAAIEGVNRELFRSGRHHLIPALTEVERSLAARPISARIRAALAGSEDDRLEIIDYAPELAGEFKRLNMRWLQALFKVEAIDRTVLGDPETHILEPGGEIFFARLGGPSGRIVGTCALKYEGAGVFEFTKLGVDPEAQGRGVGEALMWRAIARFKARAGKRLYLETNSKLKAAARLYEKTGWVEAPMHESSPYARADRLYVWNG
mgnify:CR=1 FL=1